MIGGKELKRFVAFLRATVLAGLAAAHSAQLGAQFDFGTPANMGPIVNSPAFDGGPSISTDGLSLYFTSERQGGGGGGDFLGGETAKGPQAVCPPQKPGGG